MGHYVNNNLIKDENVEYETTYHWIIFLKLKSFLTCFTQPLIHFYTDEFVITNKRVIIKTGIFNTKSFEMNHSKIESVNVDQSIFGRLFGYGSIQIVGSGGTKETFSDIKNPLMFRKKFQEFSI